jgi:hypothetical protein
MPTNTWLRSVTNARNVLLELVDIEDAGCNHYLAINETVDVRCAIPWAQDNSDFLRHHMEIRETDTGRILYFFYQSRIGNDNDIYISTTGFGDAVPIAGNSEAGGRDRNLFISADGVSLNDVF